MVLSIGSEKEPFHHNVVESIYIYTKRRYSSIPAASYILILSSAVSRMTEQHKLFTRPKPLERLTWHTTPVILTLTGVLYSSRYCTTGDRFISSENLLEFLIWQCRGGSIRCVASRGHLLSHTRLWLTGSTLYHLVLINRPSKLIHHHRRLWSEWIIILKQWAARCCWLYNLTAIISVKVKNEKNIYSSHFLLHTSLC